MKKVALVISLNKRSSLTQDFLTNINDLYTDNKIYDWEIIFATYENSYACEEIEKFNLKNNNSLISIYKMHVANDGFIIKNVFLNIKSDIYVYLDINLLDNIEIILDVIKPISIGKYDISFASQSYDSSIFTEDTRKRFIKQLIIKFCKVFYSYRFKDIQFSIKAIDERFVESDFAALSMDGLYLDLEILFCAAHKGFNIYETSHFKDFTEDSPLRFKMILSLINKIVKLTNFYSINK